MTNDNKIVPRQGIAFPTGEEWSIYPDFEVI